MLRRLKLAVYHSCRAAGVFALARRLTARRLRILCYHGISVSDEHAYSATLFMRVATLRSRLQTIVRLGYPVLPLEEALHRLRDGTLPRSATVITIDDGFYGNYLHGRDLLREFALPMTLYVTTYYVVKQRPVFRHAVKYMFWKSRKQSLDLQGLPGVGGKSLLLGDQQRSERVQWDLIEYGESRLSDDERAGLCQLLGQRLGVSYDEMARDRGLSLVTPGEIRELAELGLDVQLHTHRHRLPADSDEIRREIDDNRRVLEPLVGRSCDHFCYPSGVYASSQWRCLEELDIKSATTCVVGLNDARTPRYALRRFLDTENVRPIEFEAELSGFAELLRSLRRGHHDDGHRTSVSNASAHGH